MKTPAEPRTPKFNTKVNFDWPNKSITVVATFTSIEEAGDAVDFVKKMAKVMWENISFRGDDDYDEDELNE
jgi:hypothetical protein